MSSARLNDNGPKAKRGELRHCCLTATALMLSGLGVMSVGRSFSEVNWSYWLSGCGNTIDSGFQVGM